MLVTVATFNNPLEAHIICGRLESEGIECFLADENIVAANWLYANAVGGVKVQVRREDAHVAHSIVEYIFAEDGTDGSVERASEEVSVSCPRCSSANVSYQKYNKRVAFTSWLFLGFPLPWRRNRWVCDDCEHTFKE